MDVVIVDDQASARTMLRHIVQDIGPQLEVHDFSEADAALEWCNENLPDLLLLDEPTSAVDPQSRREFWDSLFELADAGTTLLVSTHYMDEAERCTRLGILDAGRLVADAAVTATPGRVRYAETLAGGYHKWYAECRVTPIGDAEVTDTHRTRLWLNDATRQVLANALTLLGVSAPERRAGAATAPGTPVSVTPVSVLPTAPGRRHRPSSAPPSVPSAQRR